MQHPILPDTAAILTQIKNLYDTARKLWPIFLENWQLPTFELIDFDALGIKGLAAYAVFEENRMLFNPRYYLANQKEFLFDSVGHEIAHLIAFQLYGDKAITRPHGCDWQKVMIFLGVPLNVFQNYAEPQTVESEGFSCSCSCGTCSICKKEVANSKKVGILSSCRSDEPPAKTKKTKTKPTKQSENKRNSGTKRDSKG